MAKKTTTTTNTKSTQSTRRARPMSNPGGYSGKRVRYGEGGTIKK